MDENERNYRWSESCSKVCQMCDMGEDELVEHVVLECEKYERDRMEMISVQDTAFFCLSFVFRPLQELAIQRPGPRPILSHL